MHPASGSVGVPSGSNASGMPSGTHQGSQQSSSDRKWNLVFFDISESPTGTHFNERLKQDYNPILLPLILWLKSVICMLLLVLALVNARTLTNKFHIF